jgi:dienelactone hydrolase
MSKKELQRISLALKFLIATLLPCSLSGQSAPETTGSYKVVMEMDPTLPQHTVYRPENMASVKGKLPVVAFGNGACANAGNAFENYLAEVASHGFVVAANGPIDPAAPGRPPKPGSTPPAGPPRPAEGRGPAGGKVPFVQTKTSQLYETMDWANARNEDQASRYYGKLDLASIAVMGQSCGGLQALEAAADPRVKTAVILNSGIVRNTAALPGGAPQSLVLPGSPETLSRLHTPLIYIIGGETDIAYKNAETDFAEIKNVPLFKANLMGAGHDGTLWQPHGGTFAEVATRWLLWRLKGDETAKELLVGETCGLCQDKSWKIERKNLK